MAEEWRPVVGHEGAYEVSDLGRVRSLDRLNARGRRAHGRVLKPWFAGRKRYPAVYLCGVDRARATYVHHLVLWAFVGPCPPGLERCHNDGSAQNCRLDNLRYDTPANNQADRLRHGTHQLGEQNACAVLTVNDVAKIRASALPQRNLARRYGVKQQAISKIKTRKRWAHV